MALEHALLVSLAERAASGLELTRRFDASIGFFWQASHQQIYRTLKRMETDGWVTSEEVTQTKRPAKLVYEVTRAGHAEVCRWLAEPTTPSPQRSELAVKLRGAWLGDAGCSAPGDGAGDSAVKGAGGDAAKGAGDNAAKGAGDNAAKGAGGDAAKGAGDSARQAPTATNPDLRPTETPRRELLADVRRHLAEHTARLEHYRRGCARDYPDPQALTGGDLDRYLVLRGGILQEEYQVAWLTEYLAAFPAK